MLPVQRRGRQLVLMLGHAPLMVPNPLDLLTNLSCFSVPYSAILIQFHTLIDFLRSRRQFEPRPLSLDDLLCACKL